MVTTSSSCKCRSCCAPSAFVLDPYCSRQRAELMKCCEAKLRSQCTQEDSWLTLMRVLAAKPTPEVEKGDREREREERSYSKSFDRHRTSGYRHHKSSPVWNPVTVTGRGEMTDCGVDVREAEKMRGMEAPGRPHDQCKVSGPQLRPIGPSRTHTYDSWVDSSRTSARGWKKRSKSNV